MFATNKLYTRTRGSRCAPRVAHEYALFAFTMYFTFLSEYIYEVQNSKSIAFASIKIQSLNKTATVVAAAAIDRINHNMQCRMRCPGRQKVCCMWSRLTCSVQIAKESVGWSMQQAVERNELKQTTLFVIKKTSSSPAFKQWKRTYSSVNNVSDAKYFRSDDVSPLGLLHSFKCLQELFWTHTKFV